MAEARDVIDKELESVITVLKSRDYVTVDSCHRELVQLKIRSQQIHISILCLDRNAYSICFHFLPVFIDTQITKHLQ